MRPDRLTKIVSCNLAGLACAEGERDVGRRIMRLPRVQSSDLFYLVISATVSRSSISSA